MVNVGSVVMYILCTVWKRDWGFIFDITRTKPLYFVEWPTQHPFCLQKAVV